MGYAKGKTGGPGRPKGSPNKVNAALKDIILQSLSDVGGAAYLTDVARKHPAVFCALVGRVLPLQVKEGGSDPVMPTVVNHPYDK